jgi:hypothetical protein
MPWLRAKDLCHFHETHKYPLMILISFHKMNSIGTDNLEHETSRFGSSGCEIEIEQFFKECLKERRLRQDLFWSEVCFAIDQTVKKYDTC